VKTSYILAWAGTTVDARELASYLEELEIGTVPKTPTAIERILRPV
jgi:hypothetical protein